MPTKEQLRREIQRSLAAVRNLRTEVPALHPQIACDLQYREAHLCIALGYHDLGDDEHRDMHILMAMDGDEPNQG